jgi:hypothetical protein
VLHHHLISVRGALSDRSARQVVRSTGDHGDVPLTLAAAAVSEEKVWAVAMLTPWRT